MSSREELEKIIAETEIPEEYELRVSDLYGLYELLDIKNKMSVESAFCDTLLPIYKLGFSRGLKCGKNKES